MHIKKILLTFLCLVSVNAFAAGDYEAGKIKAYTCTGCHGIVGYKNTYPMYHVPRIGGQNKEYLVIALQGLSLIHISEPTRHTSQSRMPS